MCLGPGSRTCQDGPLSEWGKVRPRYLTEYPEKHKTGLGDGKVTPTPLLFKMKNSKLCSDCFRNLGRGESHLNQNNTGNGLIKIKPEVIK